MLKFVRQIFRRRSLDAEMREEMAAHLEHRIQENITAGMSADEAKAAARRKFGHVDGFQEAARDSRLGTSVELFLRDIGFAFRQLRHSPVLFATIIATLAMGIASCTLMFTVVDTTLLHPIEVDYLDRIVLVHETRPPSVPQAPVSPATYIDLERETRSFEVISAWRGTTFNLTTDGEPQIVRAGLLTEETLKGFGNHAVVGRDFVAEDYQPGRSNVVILSPGYWQRAFASSRDVVGKTLRLNDQPYTVIGVLSPKFARLGSDIDLWTPLIFTEQEKGDDQRGIRNLGVTAVLKPGVSLAQAQAELDAIAERLSREHPRTNQDWKFLLRNFNAYLNRSLRPLVLTLLGAVGCVMAIACANVANLLMARATERRREFTIRAALGANRGRMIRQLLLESVLVATLAGGLGIALAQAGMRVLRVYGISAGTDFARLAAAEINGPVLLFTLAFSAATGILFGLAPAWIASDIDLNEALKQGARGATETPRRGRIRQTLVALQVTLAVVLLSGAGLLTRNFIRATQGELGFVPDRVATLRLSLRAAKYNTLESRLNFANALLDRLESLPQVEAASLANLTPLQSNGRYLISILGQDPARDQARPWANFNLVAGDFFKTFKIRLISGSIPPPRTAANAPISIVVNETLAWRYFAEGNAVGQRLWMDRMAPGTSMEIIGIVSDVQSVLFDELPAPQIYAPWTLVPPGTFYVFARTTTPSATMSLLRSEIRALDPDQALETPRLMTDLLAKMQAPLHLSLRLLGSFALFALLIAAVGIYGVVAYSVSQRTTEIGVRVALGADPSRVTWHFVRRGLVGVLIGLVFGGAGAWSVGSMLHSMVPSDSAKDPLPVIAAFMIFLATALIACFVPARRAATVDPMLALRSE